MRGFDFTSILPNFPLAECRKVEDPDLFFPDGKVSEANSLPIARSICEGCIYRKECLEYALSFEIFDGIWAGTTPTQRKRMVVKTRNPRKPYTIAFRIRQLDEMGRSPKQIAEAVDCDTSYVTIVLKRFASAKLKGAIQSQLKNEEQSKGLQSSSRYQQ